MANIVTMGELMLRLSPPGSSRFIQAGSMDVTYGGAEANVAVALAQWGHHARFVSRIPSHALGDAAVAALGKYGVDCTHILRGGDRLGIYFLENGASIRPSSVIYDRAHSAFAQSDPAAYDFDAILKDMDLLHISGITPVLNPDCAELTLSALKCAKRLNITVSFDLNYRAKLWTSDIEDKQRALAAMMPYVDICFGNPLDAAKCLGYEEKGFNIFTAPYDTCVSAEHMEKLRRHYDFKYLITTLRKSFSASDNSFSAQICHDQGLYVGRRYQLHIVDRVGSGDAFAAGFLHGILTDMSPEAALEYAIASGAIKHTIPGDFNAVGESEILTLIHSDGSGRVIR